MGAVLTSGDGVIDGGGYGNGGGVAIDFGMTEIEFRTPPCADGAIGSVASAKLGFHQGLQLPIAEIHQRPAIDEKTGGLVHAQRLGVGCILTYRVGDRVALHVFE